MAYYSYKYGKYGSYGKDAALFEVREAFRTIRTNLMFSVVKKGCKTIVFTSSIQGEGKTTVASNVAFSIARNNRKVLLLDLDLRRPRVHRLLKLPNTPGLTNYLGGFNSLEEVIRKEVYENLDVICAGTVSPNPAEIIASAPMVALLKEAEKHYEYIIIDTPPINLVSDALPIIKISDGVVLVARERYSSHPEIKKTIEKINFIQGKILGFVMNGAHDNKTLGYSGKKHHYYYGTGSGNSSSSASSANKPTESKQ